MEDMENVKRSGERLRLVSLVPLQLLRRELYRASIVQGDVTIQATNWPLISRKCSDCCTECCELNALHLWII